MENDASRHVAYLACGSNLGNRLAYLRAGVRALRSHPEIMVTRVSRVYETKAHTLRPGEVQPDFLNAVIEVSTTLSPDALLAQCLHVEALAGRVRAEGLRWAPRPLDLDLLLYDGVRTRSSHLTLPHPRLGERRFVLQPLADLAPNLFVPLPFDATVADLLARCPDPDEPRLIGHSLDEPSV